MVFVLLSFASQFCTKIIFIYLTVTAVERPFSITISGKKHVFNSYKKPMLIKILQRIGK
jgi:hypothetical protein